MQLKVCGSWRWIDVPIHINQRPRQNTFLKLYLCVFQCMPWFLIRISFPETFRSTLLPFPFNVTAITLDGSCYPRDAFYSRKSEGSSKIDARKKRRPKISVSRWRKNYRRRDSNVKTNGRFNAASFILNTGCPILIDHPQKFFYFWLYSKVFQTITRNRFI